MCSPINNFFSRGVASTIRHDAVWIDEYEAFCDHLWRQAEAKGFTPRHLLKLHYPYAELQLDHKARKVSLQECEHRFLEYCDSSIAEETDWDDAECRRSAFNRDRERFNCNQ